ncbi:MAG: hypothetical protein A2W31_04440 [Planctomycetes bacterium RBG_16_64_10]|nr:MAG: hypothetical protein A2W31_04440 [Planctomycetes bacterium RBG_16_64_10]
MSSDHDAPHETVDSLTWLRRNLPSARSIRIELRQHDISKQRRKWCHDMLKLLDRVKQEEQRRKEETETPTPR